MPPEIADSDAESDGRSPKRPSYSPIGQNAPAPFLADLDDPDPIENLNFSQYLSPTQRLSSMIEQHDAPPRGTGSTDQFLKEIGQAQDGLLDSMSTGVDGSMDMSAREPVRKKTKRTFSDIENASSARTKDDEVRRSAAKRTKTYDHSRSHMSPPPSSLFSSADELAYDAAIDTQASKGDQPLDANRSKIKDCYKATTISNNQFNGQERSEQKPMNLVQSCFRVDPHNVSMMKSSVGTYLGYEMDFRGTGVGIDVNANPFGSLSQISMESVEQLDTNNSVQPMDLPQQTGLNLSDDPHISGLLQMDAMQRMATSPIEKSSNSKDAKSRSKNHPQGPEQSDEVMLDTVTQDLQTEHSELPENSHKTASAPKKRGRKSKNTLTAPESPKRHGEERDELQQDDLDDLLPKEQYKPRSSRSRASAVEIEDDTLVKVDNHDSRRRKGRKSVPPEATVESPKKTPTSDLRLSDPAVIGEPKEMYKPRPSRSRSHKVIDEGLANEQEQAEHVRNVQPAEEDQSPSKTNLDTVVTPIKSAKKSGKKAKVKRSKTSAAALLRKTQEMLSDEEDKDVVWLESKPAKVVMDLPPAINTPKTEADQKDLKVEQAVDQDDQTDIPPKARSTDNRDRSSEAPKITIDLPPAPKLTELSESNTKPEPKKRGRKPKPKPEIQDDPPEDEPEPVKPDSSSKEEESIEQNIRPPLAEKNTNITVSPQAVSAASGLPSSTPPSKQTSTSDQPLDKKPTHSPLKRSTTPTLASLLTKPRVGLSRRTPIPSLLRKLDRTKEPPRTIEKKEKLSKKQKELEDKRKLENDVDGIADGDADDGARWRDRGADGMLVEWND